MLQNRWLYESKLEAQLARWKAGIAVFRAEARPVGIDDAVRFDQSIDALQHQLDMANHHLSSLRGASDEAWQNVKVSTERSWMNFTAIVQDPAFKY
ncbi:hypothetical protein [Geothrix campi]|uniref:hypothetical protein n=1 Tax=Geothrix campi TaxID=2966450 RepID=UPI002148B07F|nr:hypothetical protein [Geothrix sp. SG10]